MRSATRLIAWLGLAASLALVGFALWIHWNLDPIVRLLPVLIFGGAGLAIGLASLQGLLATATPPHPWTRPAPESLRGGAGVALGLVLVAAGVHALIEGSARTPNLVFASAVRAADAPAAYWGLVGVYLLGGAALLTSGLRTLGRRAP